MIPSKDISVIRQLTEHDLDVLITKAQYATKMRIAANLHNTSSDQKKAYNAECDFDDYYAELREEISGPTEPWISKCKCGGCNGRGGTI